MCLLPGELPAPCLSLCSGPGALSRHTCVCLMAHMTMMNRHMTMSIHVAASDVDDMDMNGP